MNPENDVNFSNPNQSVYHYLSFCDEASAGTPLIVFESRSPFGAISTGDAVDPSAWKLEAKAGGLTVTRISHKVWQEHDYLCHQITAYCRTEQGTD